MSALLLYPFATFLARGRGAREPNFIDRAVLWTTAPLQQGLGWAIDGVGSAWKGYVDLRGVRDQNLALAQQNTELRARVQELSEAELENERLRGLLAYTDTAIGHEVPARVIGVNPAWSPLSVRIDRGTDHGVQKGAGVITRDGVVGQVIRATGGYADVMLLTDPDARTAVLVQRTRSRALAAGSGGDEALKLLYLLRTEDLREEDVIVTSGTDGVFPPGLVVGKATGVDQKTAGMFQTAAVVPAVDTRRLEEVLVLPPIDWTATAVPAAGVSAATDGGVPREAAP